MESHHTRLFWDLATTRYETKLPHLSVPFRMVGCTPFLMVSYFYLWFVPPFISGRFVWYLGFYCLYQTLITVSMTPVPRKHLWWIRNLRGHLGECSHAVQEKNPLGKRRLKLWLRPLMRGCVTHIWNRANIYKYVWSGDDYGCLLPGSNSSGSDLRFDLWDVLQIRAQSSQMLHLKGEVRLFRLSFVIVAQTIHLSLAPLWNKPSDMCYRVRRPRRPRCGQL